MNSWAKRILDLVVSLIALVILFPFLALIAVLILVCDRQAPFYLARRVGREGQEFTLLKFQTMTKGHGPSVTASDDVRKTALGRILRRHKLDELPQLLHVARGQMSLVGPRPESFGLINLEHPLQTYVLSAKPGLIDPATLAFLDEETKLSGHPDPERYYLKEIQPQKLELSAAYMKDATVFSDLALILQTLFVLLTRSHG